ncbi:hypothetical protein ACTQ44_05705 [Ligilactobacillus ruminis]|uniref:hypothetical protein n=1 Tax=Ligilactobacillus ruminis TaxID=1623 RepID=UPI003F98CE43
MMDNRKRRDGIGALFLRIGGGGVDKILAFSSVFVYFGGAWASYGGIRANQGAKAASNAHCFGPGGGWPKHTANAVRLRAQAGFSTSLVSSRLFIRLLKSRYHKQIRDAALHFHETKKHVGKFQRAF